MGEDIKEYVEELTSELAFIGEKLSSIEKCLKKMSNWTEEDEKKYGENDDNSDEEDTIEDDSEEESE